MLEIAEYMEHDELVPFYVSRGLEISEGNFENPPIFSYLIKENENFVGAITCSKLENIFIIEAIAVKEEYERKKFGIKLLNFALSKMKEMNAENIILNAKNPIFFEKNGFVAMEKKEVPTNAYSYCFSCPEYELSCFPKIMKYKK